MIAIRYSGVIFAASATCSKSADHLFIEQPDANPPCVLCLHCALAPEEVTIRVCAQGGKHVADIVGEEKARRWLGDHGLRRSKGRALMDAVLGNHGPFSNPKHPKRVA